MNTAPLPTPSSDRRRWLGLAVVCLAQLMIVLDTTIVNVALPAIQRDLHFTQGNLTWVVNAFLVTFGSFLLLAGRLGDLLGRKRVLLTGVVVFTVASALCGAAPSQGFLIAARLIQGIGGALQASVILAIIVTEFPGAAHRARAMSAYVFVAVAGGSLGLLAGGALTQALSWHWIFFVNLPIGLATVVLGKALIPTDNGLGLEHGVDWLGSILVTASLMTAVYAIAQASSHGWESSPVLGFGAVAIVLMGAFLTLESRIEYPIMPLRILRLRGLMGASAVRGFLVTGMYSTFFLGTLYLEHVLHYSALQTGMAFLPWTVTVGMLSLGVTARLVARFGPMRVLVAGMSTVVVGLALLGTVGVHTAFSRPSSWPTSPSGSESAAPSCPCSPSPWPTCRKPMPGWARGSRTSRSRSRGPSVSPCSARSPPITPRVSWPRVTQSPPHWSAAITSRSRSAASASWLAS